MLLVVAAFVVALTLVVMGVVVVCVVGERWLWRLATVAVGSLGGLLTVLVVVVCVVTVGVVCSASEVSVYGR